MYVEVVLTDRVEQESLNEYDGQGGRSNPGPKPPYQALTMTAAKNREETSGSRDGPSNEVNASASATVTMATA